MANKNKKYKKSDTKIVSKELAKLKRYSGRTNKDIREQTANDIIYAIREAGESVNKRNITKWQRIINKERRGKLKLGDKPKLASVLFDLVEYWRIDEITKQSLVLPNTLIISGKMVFANRDKVYKGGEKIPDFMYKDYIRFCNDKRNELDIRDDSDNLWYVGFTQPYYDNILRNWVIEIVSTDKNGKVTDFGYDNRTIEPKSDVVAGADIGISDKKVPTQPTSDEIDKQIELEKEKRLKLKEINILIDNLKSLGYSNDEIKDFLKGI